MITSKLSDGPSAVAPAVIPKLPVTLDTKGRVRTSQEQRRVIVSVTPFQEKHQTRGQVSYVLKAEGFEDLNCVGILVPGRLLSMQVSLRPKGKSPSPDPPTTAGSISFWKVTQAQGAIEFKQADGRWVAAPTGMQLRVGDVLRTKASSRARLTFRDGTTVQVGELSEIHLNEASDKPVINLKSGSLNYFHRQKVSDIEIRTLEATASIRG